MKRQIRVVVLSLIVLFLLPLFVESAEAQRPPEEINAAIAELPREDRDWLAGVVGLMTQAELEAFIDLRQDYRRAAFKEAFWDARDPNRATSVNELRERWKEYGQSAGAFPWNDPRFKLFLLNGPPGAWVLPDGRTVGRCFSPRRELEIWFYNGSERVDSKFIIVFFKRAVSVPYEVFLPGDQVDPIQRKGLPVRNVQLLCGDDLLPYALREITRIGRYDQILEEVLTPPLPSSEWLINFASSAADLPEGAVTFDVDFDLSFPARKQSRVAVQALVAVPRATSSDASEDAYAGRLFDGVPHHDFQLVGEILRGDDLFEDFRYRFDGPTPDGTEVIPLGFTRFLRPGDYRLRLLVEDVYGERYAQIEQDFTTPSAEGLPAAEEPPARRGPMLELYPPPGDVFLGKMRFRAVAREEVDKVTFYLDERPILSKRRPPYSVELDLGETPEPHRVRVVGFRDDLEVASDQVWLNQAGQRFRVYLIEPRPGGLYPGALTARADVQTPDGQAPAAVELYLDDELVETFDAPPYEQVLRLDGEAGVVRAVARLADGSLSEDAVVVNAALAETVEVRLVEVPVIVTGRDGRPVLGLQQEDFRLFDEGDRQTIERFESASQTPLRAALLIDRSASMRESLADVRTAALQFANRSLRGEEDRVGVYSFADGLRVDSDFTDDLSGIERGLAGLDGLGGTALWDSLIRLLGSVRDASGRTAIVIFSDGVDEASKLGYEQVLGAARETGAAIYILGLKGSFPDKAARRDLEDLAETTGGRTFFLDGLEELEETFSAVAEELQARYLLAYAPSASSGDGARDEVRKIRVEVDVSGASVRNRSEY